MIPSRILDELEELQGRIATDDFFAKDSVAIEEEIKQIVAKYRHVVQVDKGVYTNGEQ